MTLPSHKNTVFSSHYDLKSISKIKKLAKKKGTPLLEVTFGKKSIHFKYSSGVGVIGFSYPSRVKGIAGELRRLE